MEDKAAQIFLDEFDDSRYPPDFSGRYEAMECLSHGQAGETLLVMDKASGKLLVAKCYDPGHPLYETTEPKELRSLSHPGLPAFAEELQGERMRCILREYIAGKTLSELSGDEPFSEEEVLIVGLQLCGILRYLHGFASPVIHRDIKPQNIVMRADGTLALIDLGISRLYAADAGSDTVLGGTHDFAPPEQYGFLQTDSRSDIYSLGILLAWMLTGQTKPILRPRTPLERVICKCTAFSPSDRFRDAAAVERALERALPAARNRTRLLLAAAGLLTAGALTLCAVFWPYGPQPSEAGFTQPLIEEAVRLMLDKGPDDPISQEELSSVTELYISGDDACSDMQSFYADHEEWNQRAGTERGPVASLRDLRLLPNLRVLCLAAQQVQDISPLANLPNLMQVELRFNDVSDISPLFGLESLSIVGLNNNPVADLSPLLGCKSLRSLDLCGASGDYDGSVFSQFGDLDFLDISNPTDSYLYLGGKSIRELKLSKTAITDLSCLLDVKGIQRLEICETPLSDISGLQNHPALTYLSLRNSPIEDFSVLLTLTNLETVIVGSDARERMEPVASQGSFSVTYQ